MEIGHFYYIDDQYFKDFPDSYLMQNKEKVNGQLHDRPCFSHSSCCLWYTILQLSMYSNFPYLRLPQPHIVYYVSNKYDILQPTN